VQLLSASEQVEQGAAQGAQALLAVSPKVPAGQLLAVTQVELL
jgi:hypothetical protein